MRMDTRTSMVSHIARLEGQLAAVKAELQKEVPDCEKASKTLLSASRSFAGLREQFVESFLVTHFVDTAKIKKHASAFPELLTLIKG